MKRLKSLIDYLSFSKKERIGILTLLVLIIATLLVPAFLSKKSRPIALSESDTAWIAKLQSSFVQDSSNEKSRPIPDEEDIFGYQYDRSANALSGTSIVFRFDPNTITREQWKQLGLRDKTIQTITNYLNKGGHFNKPEDLKKIYGLRQNDYERLAPYVTIVKSHQATPPPSQSQPQSSSNPSLQSQPKATFASIIEINTADKETLMQLPGIGNAFATRIINFRDKLGGFYSVQQISETYELPDSTFQKIKNRLRADENQLKKVNINTASVEELKAHPYLRNMANVIFNYRKEHGNFSNLSEIKNTGVITDEIYNKVLHYLSIQ